MQALTTFFFAFVAAGSTAFSGTVAIGANLAVASCPELVVASAGTSLQLAHSHREQSRDQTPHGPTDVCQGDPQAMSSTLPLTRQWESLPACQRPPAHGHEQTSRPRL